MWRREFFEVIGGATTFWAVGASAQQPRVTTIGVLVRSAPGWQQFWKVFREALGERGYIEGKNVRFEFREDQGEMRRLPELAAELVRLKVDLIVAWFTPAAIAAKQATREIPIVCALCGDMVGTGLAESLSRPGGNVTGLTDQARDVQGKRLQLLQGLIPGRHEIAVLLNPDTPFSQLALEEAKTAAEYAHLQLKVLEARKWR